MGLFEQLGLEDGQHIMALLKRLTELKIGGVCEGDRLTFHQLFIITGRCLHVNAYCIEDDCGVYFSVDRTPDMPILLAVRMSISIPLVLTAVRYENKTYVDGGLDNVFPISLFPADETLGIRIINSESLFNDMSGDSAFGDFVWALLKNLYKRLWTGIDALYNYRVIEVHTGISSLSLDLSRQDRNRLMDKGYEAARTKLHGKEER
jgi:predicted acylesterase/phospholipase RssA